MKKSEAIKIATAYITERGHADLKIVHAGKGIDEDEWHVTFESTYTYPTGPRSVLSFVLIDEHTGEIRQGMSFDG